MKNLKFSWPMVVFILIGSQFFDLYSVEGVSFWMLYQLNAFVDFTAILVVYMLFWGLNKIPSYVIWLVWLQATAITMHLVGLYSELMVSLSNIELFAVLNDMYEPTLITIFVLKMIVLGNGGYGIYIRKSRCVDIDSGNCSIAYSRDYDGPRYKTGY